MPTSVNDRQTEFLFYWTQWLRVDGLAIGETKDNEPARLQELFDDAFPELSEYLFSEVGEQEAKAGGANTALAFDERSLLRFFLSRMLRLPAKRRDFWLSNGPSNDELAAYISRIAVLAEYALCDGEMTDDVIQAMIELIADYVHNVLELPVCLDIRHHLQMLARIEPVLQSAKRYYRDHFFHSLEVCFLGHVLLSTTRGGEPLWKRAARCMGASDWDEFRVLRVWYLAALTHDIGYMVDVFTQSWKQGKFFTHEKSIETCLEEDFPAAIKKVSEAIKDTTILADIKCEKPAEDHGCFAAVSLLAILNHCAKKDSQFLPAEYHAAVRAIALHGDARDNRIAFNKEPIAFLLTLCDAVQEWNRPRLPFELVPFKMMSWLRGSFEREERLLGPLRRTVLHSVRLNAAERQIELTADRLRLELEFDERIHENDAVMYLWLDAACNLQRLDPSGLPFGLDVAIKSPFVQVPGALGPQRQMFRLRDIAQEMHMNFLDRWFPNTSVPGEPTAVTNGAVTYRTLAPPEDEPQQEYVELHLEQLAAAYPLVTRSVDVFIERYAKSRKCAENRQSFGDSGLPERIS